MSEWRSYDKVRHGPYGPDKVMARPYVPGEELTDIAVAAIVTPQEGGWVLHCTDLGDQHQFYLSEADFELAYVEKGG